MLPYEQLKSEITALEAQLIAKIDAAARVASSCSHQWGEPVYDPLVKPAYRYPGDHPGTCGSDWRPPIDVPASEKPRWTRKCQKCGYTQQTTRKKTTGVPLTREVPDFGAVL